ncbi:MarR family winged helix-turn-helix transcriptional regulator [Hamadaea tsunoensis]|uniref:MarR family winged helix-turn-helix transcriptional regulator n=1 Tax=Hamadaea tsunoensis TaxID=53368 RepID=UPI000418D0E2|nr:MarR family transcriptional regulator [Hamadaea tsunoensis]
MEPSPPVAGDLPELVRDLPSWLLTQTAAYAHRLVGDGLAEIGARRYHYRVLAALAEDGPMSQADLGRRAGIHLSDMVATVNELAEQGHVERTPDPKDRRRNVITLTGPGQHQLQILAHRVARIQDDLLAPLAPAEREVLTDLLRRLLAYHRD